MKNEEFRKTAHEFVDWMADYLENSDSYPVKSQVLPGEIFSRLPEHAPLKPVPTEKIFHDFKEVLIPGITHWQSPNFFAYFPANSSPPSVLAEMLTATLGTQCMMWETSPAAAELEEKMMQWLMDIMGIPSGFEGVIQDTASTATLTAFISARERASKFSINNKGYSGNEKFRIYCSNETHSSIEKAVRIAGFGRENLVKIDVDDAFRINPPKLEVAILRDIEMGYFPLCVVATLGTTGTTSIDPLSELAAICKKQKIWLHVDAAMAGNALILPEYQWMIEGIDQVDSFVFNPHKWLFTNFDCSVYFVKNADLLIKSFEILPEYLKTWTRGKVNNYRDWGIPLGRRFRALKLWFVLQSYGLTGLQEKLRLHINLAVKIKEYIENEPDFELLAPVPLNTICFRYVPPGIVKSEEINQINEALLRNLNQSGKLYLSHTKLNGIFTIRFVIGQTYVTENHVLKAWDFIKKTARK